MPNSEGLEPEVVTEEIVEGQEPEPVEVPTEVVVESEPEVDFLEQELEGDTFERDYVEKLRGEAARYRTERNTLRESAERYGDEQTVEKAVKLWEAIGSQEGRVNVFVELASTLGVPVAELQRLVSEQQSASLEEELEEDEDRVITAREMKQYLEQVRQPFESFQQQQEEDRARTAVDSVFSEAGISDEQTRRLVAGFADKYVNGPTLDPAVLSDAFKRGVKDYQDYMEAQAAEYAKRKVTKAKAQPKPLSGGGTSTGSVTKPAKTMAEARDRAYKRFASLLAD